jgi:ABC-type branched-subunit amino acid transport system substrate-binding protein
MKQLVSMLIAALVYLVLFSYPTESAMTILDKSKELYKAGKYDSTVTLLKNYLRKNGKDPRTEHLVPLLLEALVRQNEFTSAHRLATMYRSRFPQSTYVPRIWYVEGVAFAKEEKFPQAIGAFSTALNAGVSETLDSLVVYNTEKICDYMATDEFVALASQELNERIREIIDYYGISKLVAIGQFAKASNNAEEFRQRHPRSRYINHLDHLTDQAKQAQKNIITVGLLAPISGEEEEIGKKVVQGVQLAAAQLQPQSGPAIKTIVMDTRGNMIVTAQKTKELLDQHNVSIIIGPVLSQTATVTAAMLMGKPAIMLSPTATDEGIADIGDNIFQMNVTIGVLGRKIARYAIDNLSIKEFVIMAPRTPYGEILAASFRDEVKSNNGEIVAEEYFDEGANDYRENFQNIRKTLLLRHLERLALVQGIDFNGTVSRRDSLLYADSTLAIGGLFMPAEAEDIVMLAPQVMFNRIRTQLLGSSGWHQQKVITDGKKYVVNAIISTSFELDQSAKEWTDFVKLYKSKYNAEPDRIAALGYDAASLIINAIRETGSDDPARIQKALSQTSKYRGLSGLISFEEGRRANNESAIYKISADGFVRVQ